MPVGTKKKSARKSTAENFRLLNFLTSGNLCEMFQVEPLCIRMWRKKKGLPYIRIVGEGRDNIRFDREEVLVWARKNDKRVHLVKRR